ncbi:MAG: sigma-70 family RNA polymerase sigma factor [Actinomycetota bacterium]|nr:sigma-70 family RNA polymerase sigma factor [Actinomycetota bacterium]
MSQPAASPRVSTSAVRHLLLRFHRTGDRAARDEAVERLMPLVRRVAKTYPYREHADDLQQVACLGLVKAIDRWDPTRDRGSFTAYAVPTMLGEVRRFVRDHTWTVRPPRGLQERVLATSRATERLTTSLGRPPIPDELADEMGLSLEDVLEGLQAGQAHGGVSLDAPARDDGEERRVLGETFGRVDTRLELTEELASLGPLMAALTMQERRVIALRFGSDMVQSDIAKQVGVSQMQVSRLLRGAVSKMRDHADESMRLASAA